MRGPYEEHLPDDLQGIAARMTEQRADVDPLSLDQLKQRARNHSTARHGRRTMLKSRLATAFTALALIGGSGGAIAVANSDHHPNNHGGAADDQYRPGKGCGDKNHKHARSDECKGDNGGGNGGSHGNGGDKGKGKGNG